MPPHDDPLHHAPIGPGTRVGPWTLDDRLGSGGNATVWRAHDTAGHAVALKIVAFDGLDDADRARFAREHEVLERLKHPRVVAVEGHGHDDGWDWIAMELVEGQDLQARLEAWRADPSTRRWEDVRRIIGEAASGLQHIHEQGLVHRDVKPANVLLDAEGHVRLVDFGVVTQPEVSRITMAGSLVGTIAYMAPELIAEEPFDARADLYGLGGVLYAMLTLRRPVEAESIAGYLAHNLTTMPTPPSELDADVPRDLERLAMRLLEKDPSRRPSSARAVLEQLEADVEELDPLYGRDRALDAWRRVLAARKRGSGGLFVIRGPEGSGRSHLLRHLGRLAQDIGLTVATLDDATTTPDVLLVDDADALTPEGRLQLDDLLADGALAAVVRPPRAGAEPPATDMHVVELEPLSRRAILQLLRDHDLPTSIAAALATRLADRPAGQPGEVLSQLDALVDAGWLVPVDGEELRQADPPHDLLHDDLPAPAAVRRRLATSLADLDAPGRELLELLSLLGRPAGAALIARASDRPAMVPHALQTVAETGWVVMQEADGDHAMALTHPCAGQVVREAMDPATQALRHRALAGALGGQRRRTGSLEAARHLVAAGDDADALPMLVAIARRALDRGDPAKALEAADLALSLPTDVQDEARARLLSVRGSALLALGRWPEAVPALEVALAEARAHGDAGRTARAASDLGRALYRLGRPDRAAPLLEEVLGDVAADPDARDAARRALADIHLQAGRLDGAMALLRSALDDAQRVDDRQAEARARRGIAHVLGLEGRYREAAAQLQDADDLLADGGDPHVRAGVLMRSVELDSASGRWAFALQRAEQLLDLLEIHRIGARVPEATGYAATVHLALGDRREAARLARKAITLARPHPDVAWAGLLLGTRVLDDLGELDEAAVADLTQVAPPRPGVRDPHGQALALTARIASRLAPDAARTALAELADHTPARWGLAELHVVLDTAWAHLRLGDAAAARAVLAPAEDVFDDEGAAGALLDLELTRHAAGVADAADRARALTARLVAELPATRRETFLARPLLQALHTD